MYTVTRHIIIMHRTGTVCVKYHKGGINRKYENRNLIYSYNITYNPEP